MNKPLTLGDLPVRTFLKFFREEIKNHAEKTKDRSNAAIITTTILLNALVDTFNSVEENVNSSK